MKINYGFLDAVYLLKIRSCIYKSYNYMLSYICIICDFKITSDTEYHVENFLIA
jgi:hypothetical protein